MTVLYPKFVECNDLSSDWVGGFEYPAEFKKEMQERFPGWKDLHRGFEKNDLAMPWNLLDCYEGRLAGISMEDIVKSGEDLGLHADLVERAKEVLSLRKFIKEITDRYFPQGIHEEVRRILKSDNK